MSDPNWFYSTLAQSSAAIVGLAGGFMVSRVLNQRTEIAHDRSRIRDQMLMLQGSVGAVLQNAERVSNRIRAALPVAEGTSALDISQIETFTHPGNHGETGNYATDTQLLALLHQVASDADDYKDALMKLAKDQKVLSDNLRKGKRAADFAADWLNDDSEGYGSFGGGSVQQSLGQQHSWMRNDWRQHSSRYESTKHELGNLRTRAAIGSLAGLVFVLAAFLVFGVLVPLAYLSARAGSSRVNLLIAFGFLALLFLTYLANEVRRLGNALHLDREFW